MAAAWAVVVGVVLGIWFVASVVHQVPPPWWARVSRHDRFALLPRWRFFAPNPGRDDHHLVFRDEPDDGTVGPWRDVDVGPPRRSLRWVWQPSRYRRKALSDLVSGLIGSLRRLGNEPATAGAERLTGPYLSLLHWALTAPAAAGGRRQFAVIASRGYGDDRSLRVVYVSGWHRIADRP